MKSKEIMNQGQEKNLTKIPQRFLININKSIDETSVNTISERNFNNQFLIFWMDSRILDSDIKNAENLNGAFTKIIMDGDDIKMKAVHEAFDFKSAFVLPTIRALYISGALKEKEIIKLMLRLVDNLSKSFEVPTSEKLESLAWDIYKRFEFLSLITIIKFFEMSKERVFKSKYQHIKVHGIHREVLMDWIDQFLEIIPIQKSEMIEELRAKEVFSPALAKEVKKKLGEGGGLKFIRRNALLHEKQNELTEAFKKKERSLHPYQLYLNAMAYDHLQYKPAYIGLKYTELMEKAKEICKAEFERWKVKYQSVKSTKSSKINEKGRTELTSDEFVMTLKKNGKQKRKRVSSKRVEVFYHHEIKQFLSDNKQKMNVPIEKILETALLDLIDKLQIKSVTDLGKVLGVKTFKNARTLKEAVVWVVQSLSRIFNGQYSNYRVKQIDQKEYVIPLKEYVWRQSMKWACQKCYAKIMEIEKTKTDE